MDEEVGEISYDGMHQLVFGNTDLHPDPENKAEVLLYDKDVDGDSMEEEEFSSNKLTGEMRMVIKEILHLHNDKGVPFNDIALFPRLPAEVGMTRFYLLCRNMGSQLKLMAL